MSYTNNTTDHIVWFDTTAQLAADAVFVAEKTTKAAALDAPSVIYISNGTSWIKISDASTLAYYTIAITLGANTSVTIVDAAANVYTNGMRVQSGAVLTITAAADTGYNLSTYTVNTVDKSVDNPTTHTVGANVVIATAATEAS